MKLKRILTSLVAAAAVISTFSLTGFAVNDGEAAYCFDNESKLSDWETYGSTSETNFKITQVTTQSKNGNGCILISENVSDEVSEQFGGAYITADSVGLKNFGGCTISMSVLAYEGAEGACDNLSVFSDGMLWINTVASGLSSSQWTDITLVVPENADNSKVGFTIPTFNTFMGNIVYIDDFTITTADGVVVSNVGDYEQKIVTEESTVSTGVNIALTIVLVVLILAIVGGIGLIVSSSMKRFS